ncbi:hypothetical protein SAMN05443245_1580 [Paraburkholderia fungorum]|uniref:Uncharacterized protein n=1 Tax=Paraburkholderia fungorum TaxID=134537 RepID=A0A1H1BAY4_9BURK|nr:hypothetical protein [Paraburkholderia fungorum]SDQ49115.1 hypothetical protein SAMN05443245_1580 [Paraburkholderia fungorum]
MAVLHVERGRAAGGRVSAECRAAREGSVGTLFIRRLIMTISRIFSAVFVLLALAFGSLATSGCTSTDSGASSSSGSGSTGGY